MEDVIKNENVDVDADVDVDVNVDVEQEATDAAPDVTAKSDPVEDPEKVGLYGEVTRLRAKDRDRAEVIRQKDEVILQLQQQGSRAPATTEKSPVEEFINEFGADAPLDGRTMQAQRDWEKGQVALESQQRQQSEQIANRQAAKVDARINLSAANMGQGLDFGSLEAMGQHLLTEGDLLDIRNAGPDAAKVAYQRLEDRILRSSLAPTLKTLQKTRSSAKPKPKPKEGGDAPSDQQDTGEPEDVGMRTSTRQLSNFIFH